MDLRVEVLNVEVPLFAVGNVIETQDLTSHVYDLPDATLDSEVNGLIYTCRGGWIDTGHVRQNADQVLYIALTIAPHLATGAHVEWVGDGATTTIDVDPIPANILRREGALGVALVIAGWATYRTSIWHEVTTWYDFETIAGFSEKPSAFSPEDLYSNVLGIRLAMGAIDAHDFGSTEIYQETIAAYINGALDRLEAQPTAISRAIMAGLDQSWWDSSRRLPENLLVTHRGFPPRGNEVHPWRAEDALEQAPARVALQAAWTEGCGPTRARPLAIPDDVGGLSAAQVTHLSWMPEGWAATSFPGGVRRVDERELDELTRGVHEAMIPVFGEGFDAP